MCLANLLRQAPAQKRRADQALVNIKKKNTRIDKREKTRKRIGLRAYFFDSHAILSYPPLSPYFFFIAPVTVFFLIYHLI